MLTADFNLPDYPYHDTNLVTHLYQPLLAKTQHLPDVQAASLSTVVPLDAGFLIQLSMYGDGKKSSFGAQSNGINAQLAAATADMQRVFGFRMLQGRFFNDQDTCTSQPVLWSIRAFANAYWPGRKRCLASH